MNGDMEHQIFEGISTDECYEAECEYLDSTRDPFNTGDSWHVAYECTGSPEQCPLVAKKVQEFIEESME